MISYLFPLASAPKWPAHWRCLRRPDCPRGSNRTGFAPNQPEPPFQRRLVMEQLIADLIQARQTDATIIMAKHFTQHLRDCSQLRVYNSLPGETMRPMMVPSAAAKKTQGSKLLIHLQLHDTCHASVSTPMLRA